MSLTRWKSPSYRHEEPPTFHYGPLKSSKTGIRLVQLLPGSGNKGVAISLIDSFVTGPNKVPYDALSYTWGESARSKNISCNGRRLAVTPTLLEALQRFRDPIHQVTLWIDQICICQDRVKERNQQVQMMGDIFKAARKVSVWLGEDYDDSRSGMQLAKQLLHIARYQNVTGLDPTTDLKAHGLPKQGHGRWKALAAVLRRPWFWRTWVVQEVVLNPNVELVLGINMLTWDELESIVGLLEGPLPKVWQLDQALSASELPFSRINRIRLRHRRIIATPVTTSRREPDLDDQSILTGKADTGAYEDDPELLDLLLLSRGLGATDPRDKIYALLGLGKHDIEADYEASPEDVFIHFALGQVGLAIERITHYEADGFTSTAKDRDVRRAMILLSCAGRQNQQRSLPSWVPDWTVNLASRPLVFGVGALHWHAGGDMIGAFDCDFGEPLRLSGVLVDTVQAVGQVLLDFDDGTDQHAAISAWWQEARQIAFERIAKSPGSTLYTDAFEAMCRRLKLCKHGYYVGESTLHRRGSLLDDTEMTTSDPAHSALQTLTLGPTRGRVLFASTIGFLGLVPYGTREGDVVFVIRGADIPYVLRPTNNSDEYELIGEAYVEGIMDGEALAMGQLVGQEVLLR